jgi:alkylhydroperoxidase family enzyme
VLEIDIDDSLPWLIRMPRLHPAKYLAQGHIETSQEGKQMGLIPTAYTTKASIPLPTDNQLSSQLLSKLKLANDLNVARMFAGTDDMMEGSMGLVQAVFQAKGIDPKTRELIILRSAKLLNCPYEWQANVVMAKNAGCTQQEIEAMTSEGPPPGLDPSTALIMQATDELTRDGTLSDHTLQGLRDKFDDVTCRKLILIIAWFNLLSRFLNGCRVPLEKGDKIGSRTSPLG